MAFVADYPPRQCGIATFTADLLENVSVELPRGQVFAVAMNDTPAGYRYPDRVHFEVFQNDRPGYRRAADFLNISHVDIACLQHEYGIFGGEAGSHLLVLLRDLHMPIVTTLHTVLQQPTEMQRSVLMEVAELSHKIVVMSEKAVGFLREIYGVPDSKIRVIPHGVPDVPFVDPNYYKDLFGVEGRRVLLTFGLLSPNKGLEYMVQAMPDIVRRFPDVVYIILGATHPHILRTSGEEYRLRLQRMVRDLGIEDNVVFHNRFVSITELTEFLGAADIYVTPYLNVEQITSGTLAYAVGAGKAVVSTPYWYAEELLAEGRGSLVPFRDERALAETVIGLLENEVDRHAMRKRAYTYGRQMIWRQVARDYIALFDDVLDSLASQPRPLAMSKAWAPGTTELPTIKLDHMVNLTDDTGIIQHAVFTIPKYEEGYCTDDNARALVATVMAAEEIADDSRLSLLSMRYLAFLTHAFNKENRRFRNFMTYDRRWLEEAGSENAHGHALWGLGAAVAYSRLDGVRYQAANLFEEALPVAEHFTSPRAWAFTLIGIHEFLRHYGGATEVRRVRAVLAERLLDAWRNTASEDWPWFESSLAYANASLSHAMILSGQWMQRPDMSEAGFKSLEWLYRIQTAPQGHFAPIGSNGFYDRGGTPARFDQQPIEAMAMIRACFGAYHASGDKQWITKAGRAFEWFLGANDLNIPLYDPATGGCHDGLHPDRLNKNEGAESTISWLIALIEMLTSDRVRKEKVD